VFKLVGVVQYDVAQLVQTMEVPFQNTAVLHPNLRQQCVSCSVTLRCGLHQPCTSSYTSMQLPKTQPINVENLVKLMLTFSLRPINRAAC
jgi:hypothetical protein